MIRFNFLKNSIFQQGTILFIGGIVMNLFNYLYRVLMGKMLGPEAFGEFIVLISLFLILSVPGTAFQSAVSRLSAIFGARNEFKKLKNLFIYLTKVASLIGLGLIILSLIFANQIQNFLHLSSKNYLYLLSAIVVITLLSGLTKGILTGLRKFSKFSFAIILESVFKLGLSGILVALGFKIIGALTGFLISLILVYFLTIYFIADKIQNFSNPLTVENEESPEIWRYIFYSFLTLLFLNFLLNLDKILVKHYFSSFEAGIFSAFSTLGQAVFIGITSFGGIIFPIAAFQQAKKENYFLSLKTILLVAFLLGGIGVLISFLFSRELLLIFFSQKYLEGAPFLGYYSIAMTILGFVFLLSYFFMGLNKFKFLSILATGSILEILLISLFHQNFFQIISMFSLVLSITLIGIGILIFLEKNTQ